MRLLVPFPHRDALPLPLSLRNAQRVHPKAGSPENHWRPPEPSSPSWLTGPHLHTQLVQWTRRSGAGTQTISLMSYQALEGRGPAAFVGVAPHPEAGPRALHEADAHRLPMGSPTGGLTGQMVKGKKVDDSPHVRQRQHLGLGNK